VVWDREAATIEEGIRLLGDIRDAREDLSIIVYSVCESSHCINRCRQLGANGYLVKGEDDHALVSAVHIVYYGGDVWPDRRKAWHT
jgi:DNA-binding NarL/FixJ family response regulator